MAGLLLCCCPLAGPPLREWWKNLRICSLVGEHFFHSFFACFSKLFTCLHFEKKNHGAPPAQSMWSPSPSQAECGRAPSPAGAEARTHAGRARASQCKQNKSKRGPKPNAQFSMRPAKNRTGREDQKISRNSLPSRPRIENGDQALALHARIDDIAPLPAGWLQSFQPLPALLACSAVSRFPHGILKKTDEPLVSQKLRYELNYGPSTRKNNSTTKRRMMEL